MQNDGLPNELPNTQQDRFEATLLAFYSKTWTYHNEKEKMAHNFIVLDGALLAAAIASKSWFPSSQIEYAYHWFFLLLICALLHVMVRWQLRARREAAIHTAAIQSLLFRIVTEPPTAEEMSTKELFQPGTRYSALINTVFDFIVPIQSGNVSSTDAILPKCLHVEIEKQKTNALEPEWLTTVMSLILLSTLFCVLVFPSAVGHR
jgi:hypothetical protein